MITILAVSAAFAKSWCASPVVAHEWGVAVLKPEGGVVLPTDLPDWFERSGVQPSAGVRVRDLPADSGIRTLPVVQFWRGQGRGGAIPIAATVGFHQGTAAVWFPPVDALSLHTPAAQLTWDALSLDDTAANVPRSSVGTPWVDELRAADGALWVNRGGDSERFLFYEGRTREAPAVVVWPTDAGWSVRNRGDFVVHDLWVVRAGQLAHVDALAPGEEIALSFGRSVDDAWRAEVRAGWIEGQGPPVDGRFDPATCVMMRDPAVSAGPSTGFALYASEVDALLGVWGDRLFAPGDHLIYREDPAALDSVMPVALYTDMYHYFDWRRLGVVIVEG